MSVNQYETVTEALQDLYKKGYSNNFSITNNQARCLETDDIIMPKEMTVIDYHRFEGSSSAGDMSVLYVVECQNGIKGTLLDAYGAYSSLELTTFLKQVSFVKGLS